MTDWKTRLRSPLGQLQLLGLTGVVALGLAGFLATRTDFFEQYVREKHPEPSAATERLVRDLEEGRETPLDGTDFEALYGWWVGSEEARDAPAVAGALAAAEPDGTLCDRIERTLAAGSETQRLRAVELAGAARLTGCDEPLRWALERHRRMGPASVIGPLEALLASASGGAGP